MLYDIFHGFVNVFIKLLSNHCPYVETCDIFNTVSFLNLENILLKSLFRERNKRMSVSFYTCICNTVCVHPSSPVKEMFPIYLRGGSGLTQAVYNIPCKSCSCNRFVDNKLAILLALVTQFQQSPFLGQKVKRCKFD